MIAVGKSKYIICLAWLVSSFVWGHTSFVIRISLHGCEPSLSAALRATLSALITLILWRIFAPDAKPNRHDLYQTLIAGAMMGAGLVGIYFAGLHITGGLITTILALQPVIVTVIALILGRKGISMVNLLGGIVAVAGIYAIYQERISITADQGLAILAVTISSIIFAVGCFPLNAAKGLNLFARMTLVFASMATINWLVVAANIGLNGWQILAHAIPVNSMLAIVYLATIGNILPYAAFLFLMQEWGEVSAVTVDFAIPIVALVVDFFLEKEPIQLGTIGWFGIALVMIGVFLTNIRKRILTEETQQTLVNPQPECSQKQLELAGME